MSDRFLLDRHIEGYELLSLVVICEACGGRERFGHEGVQAWEAWAFQHWTDHHHLGMGMPATMHRIRQMAHEIGDKPYTESELIDEAFYPTVQDWAVTCPWAVSYRTLMDTFGITRSQVSTRLSTLRGQGLDIRLFNNSQEALLDHLSGTDEAVTVEGLVEALGLTRQTVNRALVDLQRSGYVVERPQGWEAVHRREDEPEPEPEPTSEPEPEPEPEPAPRPKPEPEPEDFTPWFGPVTVTYSDTPRHRPQLKPVIPVPEVKPGYVPETASERALREIVEAMADGPVTAGELREVTGASAGTLGNRLKKLVGEGRIIKLAHGVYGKPGAEWSPEPKPVKVPKPPKRPRPPKSARVPTDQRVLEAIADGAHRRHEIAERIGRSVKTVDAVSQRLVASGEVVKSIDGRQFYLPGQKQTTYGVPGLIMEAMESGARTTPEIARALDYSPNSVSGFLSLMVKQGRVVRVEKGIYALAQN